MDVQELLYQMFMSNHRFMRPSDEARSRSVWTTTARSNHKHLLYYARKNAQKVCQSPDPTLWRESTPTWMRRDYWEGLCNIWAAERWQETSTTMKVNQAANPEANKHTSGSVSFATHQSRLSYSQQMTEKYAEVEEQPQLDPEVWAAASGTPKKGHVYGFGHSMDMSRVLSGTSSSGSQVTSAFTILVLQVLLLVSDAIQAQLSQAISQAISQALSQHGQDDDCDLWKLTEFNSDSRFELSAQIHLKQVSFVLFCLKRKNLARSTSTHSQHLGPVAGILGSAHQLEHLPPFQVTSKHKKEAVRLKRRRAEEEKNKKLQQPSINGSLHLLHKREKQKKKKKRSANLKIFQGVYIQ
ncbi:hypothetical protein Taro_038355 [Colocasia esculenta]|uniref:Uncharacterized protein n=1 Tax=Colocasia esculenta TaxID=4460 RepID=A0A843WSH2_COLES|nr:hypothetical protein [Colocasia esculenta]